VKNEIEKEVGRDGIDGDWVRGRKRVEWENKMNEIEIVMMKYSILLIKLILEIFFFDFK
jgi:hypothetical protein